MDNQTRPNWDEYFMEIAEVVKKRANCLRGRVGAVIVKDKRIITTGYNGTPTGIKNCDEGGCDRCIRRDRGEIQSGENKDRCICLHAEQNALLQAAYLGISANGAVLYTTDTPCNQCAKMIVNSGIKKIVAKNKFPDELGLKLLRDVGIEVVVLTKSLG
jgi:dCMP deaminase